MAYVPYVGLLVRLTQHRDLLLETIALNHLIFGMNKIPYNQLSTCIVMASVSPYL